MFITWFVIDFVQNDVSYADHGDRTQGLFKACHCQMGKIMVTDAVPLKNVWKVTIEPSGLAFESTPALSLLNAALQACIRLPSSCRNGTCRTCLCLLKQGKIQYQIEWPGLTKEEKAEGWILPCVAIAESDLVLEVEHAVSLK